MRIFRLGHATLAQRLGWGYGIVLALLLAMAVLALVNQHDATARMQRLVEVDGVRSDIVVELTRHATDSALAMRNLAVIADPARLGTEYEALRDAFARYDTALARLQTLLSGPQVPALETEQLGKVTQADAQARSILTLAAEKTDSKDTQDLGLAVRTELGVDLPKWNKAQAEWMQSLHAMRDIQVAGGRRSFDAMQQQAASARTVMLAMTAAAFVIGLLAAVKITRGVSGPVRVAQAAAHRIAGGDLTQPIHVEQHDELGTLLMALEHMRMQLAELTGKVQVSTQQIGAASSEIAAGSRDLSTRTELAAANLQRTAASMDQVKGLVEQNLQAAQQADALAADAMSAAQRGGTVAREAVAHMGELSKAAKRIGEIVGVIERIAAQTNILAINAAVEAARAGEQGRGFSVVAGDVRLLAHQCSQSAKEVKALVDASNGTVDEGSRLVQEAGATMVGIVDAIGGVKALIGRVRASADVQSEGIRSVNAEVTQLDNATQSNAALVEQSAAAADSLKDQADRLVDAVGVFRVDIAA